MDFLLDLDVSIYHAVNGFCGSSPIIDRVVYHLPKLTGVLFFGIFGLLWFRQDGHQFRRREVLIMIVPAVLLALLANRTISTLLPFRERPLYALLDTRAPSYPWPFDFEGWSSFPSDHATYLFAITACLWVISRPSGLFFGIFSACVSLSRVYFGVHYPSDILVGALLGYAIGYAATRASVTARVAWPLLGFEKRMPAYFYGLLFMTLSELISGFSNTRYFAVAIVRLLRGQYGAI